MDGAAGAKAGGRKELGTFKTGKEVRAGTQGQGSGEGQRHSKFPSQRALRNLTGAAKELAFPPSPGSGDPRSPGGSGKGLARRRGRSSPPLMGHS